jgi:hypothetical protein
MKTPALVAVTEPPEAFAALFAAARASGERIGWLDLAPPSGIPAELERAAALGAARAVAAGGDRALAVKPLRGAPVLRDLLREHFAGCAIVLVRGTDGHPRLRATGAGFRLESAEGRVRELDADATLAELRRPRHRAATR